MVKIYYFLMEIINIFSYSKPNSNIVSFFVKLQKTFLNISEIDDGWNILRFFFHCIYGYRSSLATKDCYAHFFNYMYYITFFVSLFLLIFLKVIPNPTAFNTFFVFIIYFLSY